MTEKQKFILRCRIFNVVTWPFDHAGDWADEHFSTATRKSLLARTAWRAGDLVGRAAMVLADMAGLKTSYPR